MAKELNEDYGFKISIKTLVGIAIGITTIVSFWFAQQWNVFNQHPKSSYIQKP